MIRIGTCSWKYDSWKGIVYSNNVGKNYLVEYCKKYNTVEIDQWFWSLFAEDKVSLPQSHVVQSYTDSVPEDFKFTIKIPNSLTLTHFYRKSKSDPLQPNPYFLSTKLFNKFLESLLPMKSKIGMLMFQFEYLNKQKMASQGEFQNVFSDFVSDNNQSIPLGIEIRNPYYLNKKYIDFLNHHKLSHVFLQGYYMPSIIDTISRNKDEIKNPVVIRLHGPERNAIEKKSGGDWSKILEPKNEEISKITKIIKELDNKNLDVYVNVNNHYEGSAPRTISKMMELLNSGEE